MSEIKKGSKVSLLYKLFVDGKLYDAMEKEPLKFVFGDPSILPSFQDQIKTSEMGEKKEFVLKPEEAYGHVNPGAIVEIPKNRLPSKELTNGTQFQIITPEGNEGVVTVLEVRGENVLVDFNHPLGGKELHYHVEIMEIV